jgi:hypothetical protein
VLWEELGQELVHLGFEGAAEAGVSLIAIPEKKQIQDWCLKLIKFNNEDFNVKHTKNTTIYDDS